MDGKKSGGWAGRERWRREGEEGVGGSWGMVARKGYSVNSYFISTIFERKE
jgi:hypothetical protein